MGKTNMVEIDIPATREAIDGSGKTMAALSEEIGRCPAYLSYTVKSGRLPEYAFRRLCVLLGVSEGDLLKKQAVTPPQKAEAEAVSGCETIGYSVKLDVYPKKVRFAVLFNGEEIMHAWGSIRGARELDLMQSISYAAHMCYKQKEMKVIEEEE
jgi:hypothetical protein|nr:MAG TPA: repressor regulating protein [Caudoviricetes sp.]